MHLSRQRATKYGNSLHRSETENDCLQMAVKAVNDTIGPEGLCPTLLVYGTLTRPLRRTPAETQIRRAESIDSAMKEVRIEEAKRKIAFSLRHYRGPKAKEHEQELQRLPAGSPVMVHRIKSMKWEVPFPFVTIDGSTFVVQIPTGRKIFRSTVVKSSNPVIQTEWPTKDANMEIEKVSAGKTDSNKNLFISDDS